MSDDTSKPDAEPVDAEFEPAPAGEPAETEAKNEGGSGGGALRVVGLVIAAAAIGGVAGYAASRYLPGDPLPGPSVQGLEERVAALEGGAGSDIETRLAALEETVSARDGVVQRLDTIASDLSALSARVGELDDTGATQADGDLQARLSEAFATIEQRVEALEDGEAGAASGALETRLSEAFGEIDRRLAALEDSLETVRSEAETAVSAARQMREALESDQGEATGVDAARFAALASSVGALETRVSRLSDSLSDAADADAVDRLTQRQQALGEEVARLSDQFASEPTPSDRTSRPAVPQGQAGAEGDLASRALAFAALSQAVSRDEPFAVELEAMRRVWPSAPGLEPLSRFAREGAPTLDQLRDSFPAEAVREATGETRTFFGVLRVDRQEDAGPAAAIEAALDAGDLAAAGDAATALDGEAGAAISDWRGHLMRRVAVSRALDAQGEALSREGDAR